MKTKQTSLWLGKAGSQTRKLQPNTIYNADNLEVMKQLPSNSIDLIYIDPPFTTQAVQKSKSFDDKVCLGEYDDKWGGGINSFVMWLSVRLREMHRLLKPNGVLCVHLDYRAVHYIKIELDKIFGGGQPDKGSKHLINEIIWCYKSGGASKKSFAKKHDTILAYSKSNKHTFNLQKEKSYGQSGGGQGGKVKYYKDNLGTYSIVNARDWWQISMLSTTHSERLGYPTQKPLELLNRIINAFSNKGDVVADFFCGCGTTIDSAYKNNRFFIGVDASNTAARVMRKRMIDQHNLKIKIQSLETLTKAQVLQLNPQEFEQYTVLQIGGIPNTKQVGDGGIDGTLQDGTPIQVKQSDSVGRQVIDSMYKHLEYNGRAIIIAKSFTKGAKEECARLLNEKGWEVTLMTVDDVLKGVA